MAEAVESGFAAAGFAACPPPAMARTTKYRPISTTTLMTKIYCDFNRMVVLSPTPGAARDHPTYASRYMACDGASDVSVTRLQMESPTQSSQARYSAATPRVDHEGDHSVA